MKRFFGTLLLIFTVLGLTHGQKLADTIAINEVQVFSFRKQIARERLPQKVEVITREQIERAGTSDISEILKKEGGLDIIQYPGMLSGVGIRGFRPATSGLNQRVLVLIDGRPSAATNLAMIDLSGVERVEVIKGPASAIYGPQAVGGVINIISRKSTGKLQGKGTVGYGSFQQTEASAQVGGTIAGPVDFDFSLNRYQRNQSYKMGKNNLFRDALGFDEISSYFAKGDSTMVEKDNRGDDDVRPNTKYTRYGSHGRIGVQLSTAWRLDLSVDGVLADDVEDPGDIKDGTKKPGLKDVSRLSSDISLVGRLSENNILTLRAFYGFQNARNMTTYEGTTILASPYKSYTEKIVSKGIQVTDMVSLGSNTFFFGLENNQSNFDSRRFKKDGTRIAPYKPNYAFITTGVFAQGNINLVADKLFILGGVRFDNIQYKVFETELMTYKERSENNQFFSPSLGLRYQLIPGLNVKGTVGFGFSPADIYSVAGYNEVLNTKKPKHVTVYEGNAELKNMESLTRELGITYGDKSGLWSAELSYFWTTYKNNSIEKFIPATSLELTAGGDTIDARVNYQNAPSSTIQGLESSGSFDFGKLAGWNSSLQLWASYSHLFKANEVADEYGIGQTTRKMLNVAKDNLRTGIFFDDGKHLYTSLSFRFMGDRFDRNWNYWDKYVETTYANYLVSDFSAGYRFLTQHEVSLSINNLTDENYYEKRGYNMPGRSFWIRYSFKF